MAALNGARVIPVGDAFWAVNSDPNWSDSPQTNFDYEAGILPTQLFSLHRGFHFYPAQDGTQKIGFDGAHASDAGCYLGALVWYNFLFGVSPENLTWAPLTVPDGFANHLRRVAAQTAIL